jgi:hypothetical protein
LVAARSESGASGENGARKGTKPACGAPNFVTGERGIGKCAAPTALLVVVSAPTQNEADCPRTQLYEAKRDPSCRLPLAGGVEIKSKS